MENPGGSREPRRADNDPLLAPETGDTSSSSSDGAESRPSTSTTSNPAQRFAGSLVSWARAKLGSRGQRLPTSEEESELQQQSQQESQAQAAGPSIEVITEQAPEGGGGGGATAASGSQQRQSSSSSDGGDEIQPRSSESPRLSHMPSGGLTGPSCLVCLEQLTQEEFVNGTALRLQCNCRGDLALRHRDCVMKWVQVKGSNICELCKAEIRNIPAPPPRPTAADLPTLDETYFNDPNHIQDFMPSSQDLVFDCIRVTWVAMIVSILFFEMDLGAALWTGLLAGCAYSLMVRIMYRSHFNAMRRLAEQQAAARRELEGGGGGGSGGGEQQPQAAPQAQPPPVAVAV